MIRLSLEVNDPETESLLAYLEDRYGANYAHKLTVLRAASGWLELKAPVTFTGDLPDRFQPELLAPETNLVAV